jgi:geranylgeranyl diphosphate synthase type II
MTLEKYLSEKKQIVDAALDAYLDENPIYPSTIVKAMKYSLDAGGKRIRPVLMFAAAEAVAGPTDALTQTVLPFACAMEMIHTFSLIHDDLPCMDDDDLRRGVPTNHKVFGEAVAVLAGDGLLAEAFRIMAHHKGHVSVDRRMEVLCDIALATGARGMVGGQTIDLESEDTVITVNELEHLHQLKTGALLVSSVVSGVKLAGGNPAQVGAATTYGESVGLAFQITDDLLDIEGTTEQLGKPAGSDVENKKSTFPALLGKEESRVEAKELMIEAIAALEIFKPRHSTLAELARYIVERQK